MLRVAVTTYPRGGPERTLWLLMPAAPRVGDVIHAGHDAAGHDVAAVEITRVSWVADSDDLTGWHVECAGR